MLRLDFCIGYTILLDDGISCTMSYIHGRNRTSNSMSGRNMIIPLTNILLQEFSPHATTPLPGTSDLCFLTKTPIADVRKSLVASGVKIVELNEELDEDGCVMRTGARGKLRSVYCWDEDGNLIE